jgi:hypothetical protein
LNNLSTGNCIIELDALNREFATFLVPVGGRTRELKAYSRGVGLIDIALIVAARRAHARIWTKDKTRVSLVSKGDIFDAKT